MRYDIQMPEEGVFVFPRQRGDAAIWQFLGDEMRAKMAFGMRAINDTKLIIEVDDNYTRQSPVFDGRFKRPWKKTREEAKGGYSHEQHRLILPMADAVICATEYLADVYSDFNDNVHVCPNSVDPADWRYEREPHDAFRIVYYGSPSHVKDAPLVTEALKWASKQPGVEVWTVGFKVPSWSFEYQTRPWMPQLPQAREALFRYDLGIAPLVPNKWANGKSDVKALEYAMAGAMPLVSRAEPYRPWFDKPDFTVADGDWFERIRWAVQNQDEVFFLARDAREHVLSKRTIHRSIKLWKAAIS